MESLTLISNPGSSSRKYAVFNDLNKLAEIHFEQKNGRVTCGIKTPNEQFDDLDLHINSIEDCADHIVLVLQEFGIVKDGSIDRIGLRIVAPGSYFLQHRIINQTFVDKLEAVSRHAPIHIKAILQELESLQSQFQDAKIIGVSDSAFHANKPDYAWNYGLPIHDADRLDIKRFGYHGISVESVVNSLKSAEKLTPKAVVCHVGGGVSVTALWHGKSIDNSMGYSPLEGTIMSTRSGSLDPIAFNYLRSELNLNDKSLIEYLNNQSGLLGLSNKSSDLRDLLSLERDGNHHAKLAIETFVYNLQKSIGQAIAALGGADMLVFTGTIGERSSPIRRRVLKAFEYADFLCDVDLNKNCQNPTEPTLISQPAKSKPILVVPTNESRQMAVVVKSVL